MLKEFRKLRFGFANLQMLNVFEKEAEEKAVSLSDEAKNFLEKEINVEVFCNLTAVTNLDEAAKTWQFFKSNNVDAVILFSGTFSLSNLMAEIIRNLEVPFLAWGLDEYLIEKRVLAGSMIGLMPTGAICKALKKKFSFAYGSSGDTKAREKVKSFTDVVRAIAYMQSSKIGLMGARPDGFEIAGFDELSIKRIFGTTINKFSMTEVLDTIDSISAKEIDEDMEIQKKIFSIKDKDLEGSRKLSQIYLGVKQMVEKYKLNSFAPQCWPELRMERRTPMCPANGRLTAEGIMASCECDMDCALSMLSLHALTNGSTPWTADFVNMIKENDSILFWHCGNASYNLSDEKPEIEVVYEGLAQTAALRPGVATVLRLNHFEGSFQVFAGLGEVIQSKPLLKGSNMYLKMRRGNMEFVEDMLREGVPHHCVLVYGDVTKQLQEFANLKNLPAYIV